MLGKEESRNLIIAWDEASSHAGRGKTLSAFFVHFKAGSEILPVRSGAAELDFYLYQLT
jgi:hypothetical protein